MTPPKFWYRQKSILARLLTPLSFLWIYATKKRMARESRKLSVPVICVGNINLGGVGKTPTTIALIELLRELGFQPVILMRGYGGREKGPLLVADHSAAEVGDEAVLLSSFAPVVVAQNRASGGVLAEAHGDIIIMDDGLQNPDLFQDIKILVIDSDIGFGNGRVFPAGPLREKIETALPKVDFALLIGIGMKRAEILPQLGDLQVLTAELAPINMGIDWQGKDVFAFAGIGRPEKFFKSLRDLGANLVETHSFSDHAEIPTQLLERMEKRARALGAQMVTTEKDAARLPINWRGKMLILVVRLNIIEGDLAETIKALLQKIGR